MARKPDQAKLAPEFELPVLELDRQISELREREAEKGEDHAGEIRELEAQRDQTLREIVEKLTPYQRVKLARHPLRPQSRDYIAKVFDDFLELHGDRRFGDDRALITGLARLEGQRLMLIAQHKGKDTKDKMAHNFGMPNPEGYRKALRLMQLAEKYGLPIVCMVDTPAAYPGREAEERGQAEAIARNLTEMATLEVPIIVVITGEGGSGGALGIAVGDVVLMLRYAVYSVIPPEGCAAILWRDADKAPQAADALKITSDSLLELGVIDGIIDEPAGGAHRDPETTIAATKDAIVYQIQRLKRRPTKRLVDQRYHKFAKIGRFPKKRHA